MKKSKLLLSVSLISLIISFENLSFSQTSENMQTSPIANFTSSALREMHSEESYIRDNQLNEQVDSMVATTRGSRNLNAGQMLQLRQQYEAEYINSVDRLEEAAVKVEQGRINDDILKQHASPGKTASAFFGGTETWDKSEVGATGTDPKITKDKKGVPTVVQAAERVMTQDERNAISAQNYDPNNFNNQGILKAVVAEATSAQAAEPVASATSSLAEQAIETAAVASEEIAAETPVILVATTSANETTTDTEPSAPVSATDATQNPAPATIVANGTTNQGGTAESASDAGAGASGAETGYTKSAGDDSKSSSDDQSEQQQSTGNQQESSEQQQGQTNEESKPAESDESEDDLDPDKVKAQEVSEGDKEDAVKAQNHLKNSGIELNDKASHAQQIIDLATRIEARLKEIAATSDKAIEQLINETAKGLVPEPQFSKPGDNLDAEGKLRFIQQQIETLKGYNPTAGSIDQDTLITQVNQILKAENDLMDNFEAFTKVSFAETFREIKALQKELTDKISEFEEIAKNAKTAEEREMAERQAEALRAQEEAAARAVYEATQKFDQLMTGAQSKHQSATLETENSLSNIATKKVKSSRDRQQTLGTSKQAAEKLASHKVRLEDLKIKVTLSISEFKGNNPNFKDVKARALSLGSKTAVKKHLNSNQASLQTLYSIINSGLGTSN